MMSTIKIQSLRWGPAILVMALIFFASGTQGSRLPELGSIDFFAKKGAHMAGYALLAIAYLRGLTNGKPASGRQAILAIFMALAYAASDEFHQLFVPERNASLADVGIDALGGATGVFLRIHLWRLFSTE